MGTTTEINDYLRLLYARVGTPYCINGHGVIKASSVEQIVDKVLELSERQRLQILAPVIRKKKGQHKNVIEKVQKDEFYNYGLGRQLILYQLYNPFQSRF